MHNSSTWFQRQWDALRANDWALLRSIPSSEAQVLAEYISGLREVGRQNLMEAFALGRSTGYRPVGFDGPLQTDSDQSRLPAWKSYQDYFMGRGQREWKFISLRFRRDVFRAVQQGGSAARLTQEQKEEMTSRQVASSKDISAALKKIIFPVFPHGREKTSRSSIRYLRSDGNMSISLNVNLDVLLQQISYDLRAEKNGVWACLEKTDTRSGWI